MRNEESDWKDIPESHRSLGGLDEGRIRFRRTWNDVPDIDEDQRYSGLNFGPNFGREYDEERGFFQDDRSWDHYGKVRQLGDYSRRGPKGWRRSDHRITEDVCEALTWNPKVDASDVEVSVSGGRVFLRGWVNDRDEKREAERCIEDITGVEDVSNELMLRSRRGGQNA